jgi:ribose-phosphate pyrophosphokinase
MKKFPDRKRIIAGAPDVGSVARTRAFAVKMGLELAIIDKRREKANKSEVMNIIGDVKDKNCIILDDLVDTAGTLTKVAQAIKDKGAARVFATASHAVLSGSAKQKIQDSCMEELVITDSIPLSSAGPNDKIIVLSIASILAEAIMRISNDESISALFL